MRLPFLGERGAITAEMIVALSGVQAGLVQLSLEDQAALDARYASLGGEVAGVRHEGDLLCVEREKTLTSGLWAIDPLVLRAEACALRLPASG